MIIGVDAAVLGCGNETKAGNYWLSYKLLSTLCKVDSQNQYRLYSFDPIDKEILGNFSENFKNIVVGPKKYWMQLSLSRELLLRPVDIFLGLNQALPLYIKTKCVVFCLDLAFEKFPELFSNTRKLSWQTRRAVAKANKVIAISNSTKKDLEEIYNLDTKKIKVIYLS